LTTQLLVPIHTADEGDCNTGRLAAHVIALATHLQADVSAVVHVVDFPPISNPFARSILDAPALISQAKAVGRAHGQSVVDALRRGAEGTGLSIRSSEAECFSGSFGGVVAELARYSDITVFGIGPGDGTIQGTAEAVLFGSGRPIMLIPESIEPAAPDRVLIAWDGSRAAARAVADALGILSRAASVVVLTVADEKPLPEGDIGRHLVGYLASHGVRAERVSTSRGGRGIGAILQEQAKSLGSTLLVMGGFGHSRVRDFVLGGATRTVLSQPLMPVFLSH